MVALTLGLWLGLAAAPASAATPPPASFDNKGVNDWLKAYIHWVGWTIITADQQAVALGSPEGVERSSDGLLHAKIRREYYVDHDISGPTRSIMMSWIVDCEGRRIRVVEMTRYTDSNLSGDAHPAANPDAAWLPVKPDSQNEKVVARICEAPKTGRPLN